MAPGSAVREYKADLLKTGTVDLDSPGEYLVAVIVREQVSNRVALKVEAPEQAFKDEEVARFLAAERAKLPAMSVRPEEGSDGVTYGEAAGCPPVPSKEGIALAGAQVASGKDAGRQTHLPATEAFVDVTVVVGTFGADEWRDLAMSRAIPSVGDAQSVHVHGDTLAAARNQGLEQVTTEWVTFLDADDELTPGYFDAMNRGTADLRAPAVEYVKGSRVQRPYVPRVAGHRHECSGECLPDGNWLVIGTVTRTELVRGAGGFR